MSYLSLASFLSFDPLSPFVHHPSLTSLISVFLQSSSILPTSFSIVYIFHYSPRYPHGKICLPSSLFSHQSRPLLFTHVSPYGHTHAAQCRRNTAYACKSPLRISWEPRLGNVSQKRRSVRLLPRKMANEWLDRLFMYMSWYGAVCGDAWERIWTGMGMEMRTGREGDLGLNVGFRSLSRWLILSTSGNSMSFMSFRLH